MNKIPTSTEPAATKPDPASTRPLVNLPEREAEILRKFREDLDVATTLDQTSIRTALLGRHE